VALECLRKHFRVDVEGLEEAGLEESVAENLSWPANGSAPKKHNLRVEIVPFCVQEFTKDGILKIAHSLLQVALLQQPSEGFFSFTEVGDEISIMADEARLETLQRMTSSLLLSGASMSVLSDERWQCIRVADGPLGFDECGVVAGISAALAEERLPIMYLSTFNTDRVLVLLRDSARALQLLSKSYNVENAN
jgi:hypothetical protein